MFINAWNHKNRNAFVCSSTVKDVCLLYAKEPLDTTWRENKNGSPSLVSFPMAFFPHSPSSESTPQVSLFPSLALLTSNTYTHILLGGGRRNDFALCISCARFRRLETNYIAEVRLPNRQLATFGSFAKVQLTKVLFTYPPETTVAKTCIRILWAFLWGLFAVKVKEKKYWSWFSYFHIPSPKVTSPGGVSGTVTFMPLQTYILRCSLRFSVSE
jgi:hypothetical protein